jgi:SAM-dependent methyltransferase
VSNTILQIDPLETSTAALAPESVLYSKVEVPAILSELIISQAQLRCFFDSAVDTAFPLEYAFHLLGDMGGRTVVDLGCGDGLNAVTLASMGARVIAVDSSHQNLKMTGERARANGVLDKITLVCCEGSRIPVADSSVDRVLCVALSDQGQRIEIARQIRRILKPGGNAVFMESLAGPRWVRGFTRLLRSLYSSHGQTALTPGEARSVSRAVGYESRSREFRLASRLLERIGVRSPSTIKKASELDAWILSKLPFTRALATLLVWEAGKEC